MATTSAQRRTVGTMMGGAGRLRLEGDVRGRKLAVDVDEVTLGTDLRLIIDGKLDGDHFYATMCVGDKAHLALLHTRFRDVSITMALCDEERDKVGVISLVSGPRAPKHFRVDLKQLNASKTFDFRTLKRSILDGEGAEFAAIATDGCDAPTVEELRGVFANDPAYVQFMRGDRMIKARTNWAAGCWAVVIPLWGILALLHPRCRKI